MSLRSFLNSLIFSSPSPDFPTADITQPLLEAPVSVAAPFDSFDRYDADAGYDDFSSSSWEDEPGYWSSSYEDAHQSSFNSPSSLDPHSGTGPRFGIDPW